VKLFLTREQAKTEKTGPGDDVFMVGRFVNHEGRQRNTPSVRFGNISMLPDEPVAHQSNTPREQISFAVEMRSIPGYSGSPVFVYLTSVGFDGGISAGQHWLLGVDWGYIRDHERANTGMSGVVPAWCLLDLLNRQDLFKARQEEEAVAAQRDSESPTGLA
jgi:hypothetical protein